MDLELRDYQGDVTDRTRSLMQGGDKSILIVSPTGSGKTPIAAYMMGSAAERGMDSLFLVHRRELVKQSLRAFTKAGIPCGVIANGFEADPGERCQIASIQTYARRLDQYKRPKLLLWDECQHVAAGTWAKVYDHNPSSFHVGLTATPKRGDGTGLGRWFKKMVQGPTPAQLIAQGWLVDYRMFRAPDLISIAGVNHGGSDYNRKQLAAASDKPRVIGNAIAEYREHCPGARAVVFCVDVDHSRHTAAQFNAAGIPAAHIDADTPLRERDDILERYERGIILVLCNVELFGEGYDLAAIEAVILLRWTESLALYLQMIGRALRPVWPEGFNPTTATIEERLAAIAASMKPYATILDQTGNYQRFGVPDADRVWTLDDDTGESSSGLGAGGSPTKECGCRAILARGALTCKNCGRSFGAGAEQIEYVSGRLVEVVDRGPAPLKLSLRAEQFAAKSLAELIELGVKRGYKSPTEWATSVFAHRIKKEKERANAS